MTFLIVSSSGPRNETTAIMAISEEDRRKYLLELQAQTTPFMIPGMVAILLLALVGLIGNSLVLYVYSRKFVLNGTRVLILNVAAFDLFTNVFVIPAEVYSMFNVWDFDQPWLCRSRQFIKAFTTIVSAMLLVALAVVRYRKVCVPLRWQISAHQAKITAIVLMIAATLCATPYAIVSGRYTNKTPHLEINGYECTVDDAFVDTMWPLINHVFFIFLYFASSTTIVVLYLLVGIKTVHHIRTIGQCVNSGPLTSDNAAITSNSTSVANLPVCSAPDGSKNTVSRETPNECVKMFPPQKIVTFSKQEKCKNSKCKEESKSNQSSEYQNPMTYLTGMVTSVSHSEKSETDQSRFKVQGKVNSSKYKELGMKPEASQGENTKEEEEQDFVKLTVEEALHVGSDGDRDEYKLAEKNTAKTIQLGINEPQRKGSEHEIRRFENRNVTRLPSQTGPSADNEETNKINTSDGQNRPGKDSEIEDASKKSSQDESMPDGPKRDLTNPSKSNVNQAGIRRKRSLTRTTVMLVAISAVYILGFLPYLVLAVYYTLNDEEYKSLNGVGLALYNLFVHSFLLNSASNAVIYWICDLTFRAKCVSVIRKKVFCIRS